MILKNRQSSLKIPPRKIRETVSTILTELGVPDSDLDLTLVGDAAVRGLNRKFRGIDRVTDVLSFPLWEKRRARKNGTFLGDVVISGPQTLRQAREYRKKSWDEFCFLLSHGILHLLGYDHEKTLKEEKIMQRLETKLLAKLLGKKESHR